MMMSSSARVSKKQVDQADLLVIYSFSYNIELKMEERTTVTSMYGLTLTLCKTLTYIGSSR